MADHRAEQIAIAVLAKVTGLATTGARVFRGRVYPLQDTEEPALCVFLRSDEPNADTTTFVLIDSNLSIAIQAYVKTSASQVDTLLNQIRKEVTVALQADYTQGLAFIIDTVEGGVEYNVSGDADKPAAVLSMDWLFKYRRSRTDPS